MADPGTDQAIQQIRGGAQAQEYDKLNPAVATGNQESFLNYSKLGNLPNITGDLFKELGETVKAGVTGLDTFFKERIRGEATTEVDKERELTTARLMDGPYGSRYVPPEIAQAVRGLGNIKTASEQGVVRPEYYQMNLDAIARNLRSRYPGYREHIDNVISDLTGGTPANKVITDLFHGQAGKSDPEQRLSEHLTKELIDKMPGGADYLADFRQKNGRNPSNNEMMVKYGGWQTSNLQMQVKEKEIKLDQDLGKADEREVGKAATQHYRFMTAQALQGNGSLFSKFKTQLEDAQTTLETSGTLTPDKQSQLMLSANALEMKIKAQAEASITQFSDVLGTNKKGYLTTADAENIRKESTALSEMIRSGLGKDGKILPGILGAVKTHLDDMSNFNQNELISKYPAIAAISAGRHLVGDNTMAQAMLNTNNGKLLGDSIKDFNNYIKATMASGGKTPLKILDEIKDRAPNPNEHGILLKEGIDSAKKAILNTENKRPDATALSLYQDEFISKINAPKAERQKLYAELSSPEMLNRMEQLRKEGHPELHDKYTDWVYQTGSVLARPEIQSIASINAGNKEYKVEFDPKSLTFTGEINPNAPRTLLGARKSLDPDATGRTVVDRMNALSAPLIASLKSQGLTPDAINTKLQETFGAANFNLADITKQEEVKGDKPNVKGTPNFRAPEKKDESRVPISEMHKEAAAAPISTLTPEDIKAIPPSTSAFHIAKVGPKFVVVPNLLKSDAEIKKYLENKESPAYGLKFDSEESAKLHMLTLDDLRRRKPEKYKSFGAQ